MKKLIAYLAVLTLPCSRIWAAPGPDQKHITAVKKKVAECVQRRRSVTIETYDERRLQGSISEANADVFVLINKGRSTTLTYADVKKVKWPSAMSRHANSVVTGAAFAVELFGLVFL
jgi:hypothetical protein